MKTLTRKYKDFEYLTNGRQVIRLGLKCSETPKYNGCKNDSCYYDCTVYPDIKTAAIAKSRIEKWLPDYWLQEGQIMGDFIKIDEKLLSQEVINILSCKK